MEKDFFDVFPHLKVKKELEELSQDSHIPSSICAPIAHLLHKVLSAVTP